MKGERRWSHRGKENPLSKKRIYIIGVGGQGTLIATALIGQAALLAGINANLSEIHGMAQRGGIVETSVTLGNLLRGDRQIGRHGGGWSRTCNGCYNDNLA